MNTVQSMKKRGTEEQDLEEMVDLFTKKAKVCDCRVNASHAETVEIDTCWKWLERSHPIVYARISHQGRPNSGLFRSHVSNVYRGIRLVRPDVVQPLGTVDSIAGNCRAFGRIVDRFPCLFS